MNRPPAALAPPEWGIVDDLFPAFFVGVVVVVDDGFVLTTFEG